MLGSFSLQSLRWGPQYRAVGRSENPGVPVLFGGPNLPPLVEIRLTNLPKSGGAMAPPAPPGTTGLNRDINSKHEINLVFLISKLHVGNLHLHQKIQKK